MNIVYASAKGELIVYCNFVFIWGKCADLDFREWIYLDRREWIYLDTLLSKKLNNLDHQLVFVL